MVTRSAAGSVGVGDQTGRIEAGKLADLTLIDMNTPAIRPLSNLVNYRHPGGAHLVMTDGVFLMRDRRRLTIDEPALLAEALEVNRRVWERMIAANPDIARPNGELPWTNA